MSIFDYDELTPYQIIFPDLVGHGDSSTFPDFSYSMDNQAKVLYQFLEKLPVKDKIVLIPHSMGGPIAVSLAEKLGKRVIGMIYAEGNLDEGDCFFSKYIIDSYSFAEWMKYGFDQTLADLQKNPETKKHAIKFAKTGPETIYRSSQDLVRVSLEDTLITRLEQLSIPILGMFGENNKGTFSSERKLASKFSVVFIPNAGHAMMYDNPLAFYNAIIDFLKQFK